VLQLRISEHASSVTLTYTYKPKISHILNPGTNYTKNMTDLVTETDIFMSVTSLVSHILNLNFIYR